ncbi:MAG: glycolate oxidase subunit GlcF [Alphaproteobacteria bacterium]|nr:glycolate oxidase subunit GlcF [Alphaproteobacteria bacterium]
MQTRFSDAQRADPDIREAEGILRSCVHCGFCTATCPTYVLLGDELDSPRGRIYLIKEMLEGDRPATATVVKHIDRCLSCLGCVTTCPSGVDYMHLIDHARAHIEKTYRRPLADRLMRTALARVLPRAGLFRAGLAAAGIGRRVAPALPARLLAMLALLPVTRRSATRPVAAGVYPASGPRRMRVALLAGCVQNALVPDINAATVRFLTRHGCEVVIARGAGCCGAIAHHLGRPEEARGRAAANIAAWRAVERDGPLDAVIVNASGCGTMVKDYGHLLARDARWSDAAARIAGMTRDVSEIAHALAPTATRAVAMTVAYHSACSLRNGQKITDLPKRLLAGLGFTVATPREDHLCCGSAGTYNILQPEIATALRDRKVAHVEATGSSVIATGNIGCMMQIGSATRLPVVHTVALLDWATGGPAPSALADRDGRGA